MKKRIWLVLTETEVAAVATALSDFVSHNAKSADLEINKMIADIMFIFANIMTQANKNQVEV